jgi:hypothetical protein
MARLIEWTAHLTGRDAPLKEFLAGRQVEVNLQDRIRALRAQLTSSTDYASHQGATVTPRPFWVVDVRTATRSSAGGIEEVVPLLQDGNAQVHSSQRASRVQGQGKRKQVWRGIALTGEAPSQFLFGLLTSRYVGNFSILHRDLCFLPAASENGRLNVFHNMAARAREQRTLQVEGADEQLVRRWVALAQTQWKRGRKADQQALCTERLDYNGSLASQPANSPRVVHTRSGNFYAALLRPTAETSSGIRVNALNLKFCRNGKVVSTTTRPLGGVVVDNLLHWIEVSSVQEGYWLVGILNSVPFIRRLEKEVQNRDFYSAPSRLLSTLGLRFDAENRTHTAIAESAKLIESIKTDYDRTLLAEELGKDELSKVDDSDASSEVPRLKWSFDQLCDVDKECAVAFAKINSLSEKLIHQ